MKNKTIKIVIFVLISTFSIITSLTAQIEYAQAVIESQMKRTSAKDLGRWVYITGFYMRRSTVSIRKPVTRFTFNISKTGLMIM